MKLKTTFNRNYTFILHQWRTTISTLCQEKGCIYHHLESFHGDSCALKDMLLFNKMLLNSIALISMVGKNSFPSLQELLERYKMFCFTHIL